jgi:hypothetical protein
MKKLVFLAALLAAGAAMADLVATQGADSVRLTSVPCAAKHINAKVRSEYRASSAVIGGRRFVACWTLLEKSGAALVLYEDGDFWVAPMGVFKNVPGV